MVAFAALALALAMVGVFGVPAHAVQRQVRDFGVRRALGATTRNVLGEVASNAVRIVGAGTAVGLVLAAALSRLLTTVLYGVRPLDPATFGIVIAVVADRGAVGRRPRVARGYD